MLYHNTSSYKAENKILPIIIESCDWKHSRVLFDEKGFPRGGDPVLLWPSNSNEWETVTDRIKAIVREPAEKITLSHIDMWLFDGIFQQNVKCYHRAIGLYTRILDEEPKNIEAYNRRGMAMIASEQYDDAIANFTKALEIDSDNYDLKKGLELATVKKEIAEEKAEKEKAEKEQ